MGIAITAESRKAIQTRSVDTQACQSRFCVQSISRRAVSTCVGGGRNLGFDQPKLDEACQSTTISTEATAPIAISGQRWAAPRKTKS